MNPSAWDQEGLARQDFLAERIVDKIAMNVIECNPLKAGWNRMGFQKRKVMLTVWKALVLKEFEK